MKEIYKLEELRRTIPWKFILIFIIFSVAIILSGIYFYQLQRERVYTENQISLTAISTLKIEQIEHWHSERMGDAFSIMENEPLLRCIKQYMTARDKTLSEKELTKWMNSVFNGYDYSGVCVFDTLLVPRLSVSRFDSVRTGSIRKEIANVMKTQIVVMTDLYRTFNIGRIHIDMVVPLIDPDNPLHPSFGTLILRIDPDIILFPLIQSWPTPSKSSETLILRNDGDSVTFLNELRHEKNTALNLKIPLTNKTLLATMAIRGKGGMAEGTDYRNIEVVGYLSYIPDFNWYMVAKIDKQEIQVPLKRYIVITLIVCLLLILITASVFGFFIWNQQVKMYRMRLKDEMVIRESEDKFNTAFRMSPVSVTISTMHDNRFIDVNNTFLKDMEYTRDEVIGRTAKELNVWGNEEERLWVIDELREKEKIFGKVISYKSKKGNIIFGLSSMAIVNVKGVPCNISTVVNITEIRKAEEKLIESEELFRKLFENMLNGFAYCKMLYKNGRPLDLIYINVNEAFESLTGLKNVIGKKISEVIPGIQESDPELIQRYGRVALTGIPEVFEVYVESLKMWFSISLYSPRKDYFVAVFDVITARKEAQELLSKSEERYRLLFESISDAIMISELLEDGNIGKFIQVNDAACKLLGYTREELMNKTPLEINSEKSRQRLSPKIKSIIKRKHSIVEAEHVTKDGRVIPVEISITVTQLNNKTILLSIARDVSERKLAENKIMLQSEILSNMAEAVYLVRMADGIIVFANSKFEGMFGYDEGEMIGKHVAIVNAPTAKSPEQTAREIMNSLSEKGFWTGEVLNIRKDGTPFFTQANVTIFDHSQFGEVLISVQNDITDRKKAEEALRLKNFVFDSSIAANSISDIYGRISEVNDSFLRIWGYSDKNEVIGMPISDFILNADEAMQIVTALSTKGEWEGNYTGLRKDGSTFTALGLATDLKDESGDVIGFQSAVLDVTESIKLARQVEEERNKLASLINSIPDEVWYADSNKKFTLANPTALADFGLKSTDELEIEKFIEKIEVFLPDGSLRPVEMAPPLRALAGEIVKNLEELVLIPNIKELRYRQVNAAPVKDNEGNIIGAISVVRDITDLKTAELKIHKLNAELEQRVIQRTEQLATANKELEAFSYSVSHDLRAPLRAVNSYTNILLEDYEKILDDEGRRICGIISRSATQMGELIDDLLSFSKIGRSTMNPTAIDMKKMVIQIFEGMTLPDERVRINFTVEKLKKSYGDVALMGQVWINLLSNALKYSSKEKVSEISIGSQVNGQMVTYFVKDNGVGFEMEYSHKLFGVFQRLHSEREFEGNGVGLAIIKRIILRHGGAVWAEGEVGKGATFYFSLPIQEKTN